MIKGVLFDFDGVVADTMSDNFEAWKMAFGDFGIQINKIDYYILEGMGRKEIAFHLSNLYNLDKPNLNIIVEKKEKYYQDIYNFKYFDFIVDIFELLKENNIKIGLVTGASKNRINSTLDLSLKSFFNSIITVDDVTKGKPDPEPYLKGVEKLELNKENIIVIENAKLGIESAQNAGLVCYAIETTLDQSYLSDAEKIFTNHKDLYSHLSQNLIN